MADLIPISVTAVFVPGSIPCAVMEKDGSIEIGLAQDGYRSTMEVRFVTST